MTRPTALVVAATRLREIQDLVDRHDLPDHDWAEELVRTPDGSWTQAYVIRAGRAQARTDIVWVPRVEACA